MATPSIISVVEDDASVRASMNILLRSLGYVVHTFESAEEFLASDCVEATRCLILDISMPGMTGPDLQVELAISGHEIPIIFITAEGDEIVRARVLELGAMECLFKPFSDTALIAALNIAFGVRSGI